MACKKISYNDLKKNENSQLEAAFHNEKPSVQTGFENVKINEIRDDPKDDFVDLFPLDENSVQNIAKSMEAKGYDKTQPVHLAKILEEKETVKNPIRIDGAHRVAAARIAKLEEIPCYIHTFETRNEALIYAYELQLNRRNLEPYQKLDAMQKLDQLKNPGRKTDDSSTGKSAEEVAKVIGVSTRTAERMRNIINNGDEETIEAVKSGEMSVFAGDKKTNEKKQRKLKISNNDDFDTDDEVSDLSDSLSDNSGTPQGLNFNHSDGIERPHYTVHPEDDTDRWIKEKNIQVESARKEGLEDGLKKGSDLAYEIYEYILSGIDNGKSADDLRNDEKFKDFSVMKIYKAFGISDNNKSGIELQEE